MGAGRLRASHESAAAIAVLRALFGERYLVDFAVRLWDGSVFPSTNRTRFELFVNEAGALRAALTPPVDLGLGRAFARGTLEIRGSLETAVEAFQIAGGRLNAWRLFNLARLLRRLPKLKEPQLHEAALHGRVHSKTRDRDAIRFHYDQPVEFYRTFLDPQMLYSAAYYKSGAATLEEAQLAKLDATLRKLQVTSGERLLDIGCGWGALVIRVARNYGANALGITLSQRQYDEARCRIAQAGLENRARVELRDYRDLQGERFDKVVSIGMFEHVGRKNLPRYFRAAYEALRPGGLFLNAGIALGDAAGRYGKSSGFMQRLVFPDGELLPIGDTLSIAQRSGFEVVEVESLREDYARTCREWVTNLERNRDEAVAATSEATYRVWRLYIAGSASGFSGGRLTNYQVLFARR